MLKLYTGEHRDPRQPLYISVGIWIPCHCCCLYDDGNNIHRQLTMSPANKCTHQISHKFYCVSVIRPHTQNNIQPSLIHCFPSPPHPPA